MFFFEVSPMKGVMRFGKKEKLAPRFIEPFEVLERVGAVAYHLACLGAPSICTGCLSEWAGFKFPLERHRILPGSYT